MIKMMSAATGSLAGIEGIDQSVPPGELKDFLQVGVVFLNLVWMVLDRIMKKNKKESEGTK
jgi:hypothetical protein